MIVLELATILMAGTLELAEVGPPEFSPQELFPLPDTVVPANASFRVFDLQQDATLQREVDGTLTPVAIDWGPGPYREPGRVDMGPLTPGGVLNAVISCEGCSESEPVSWTVAESEDIVAPAYSDQAPRTVVSIADQNPRRWGVRICLPPLVIEEPAFHVLVHEGRFLVDNQPNNNSCRIDSEDGTGPGPGFYTKVDEFFGPSEYCFTARVVDAAGNEAELQETCVPLESDEEFEGCGQSSVTSAQPVLGLLLLLRRRRPTANAGERRDPTRNREHGHARKARRG